MKDWQIGILVMLGFLVLIPLSYFAMAEAWYFIHWNVINHEFRMLFDRTLVLLFPVIIISCMVYG